MQPEYGAGRILATKHALFDHKIGATFFTSRRAFLSRLKNEFHSARDLFAHARQHLCRTHKNRHVRVVPASMHDAGFHTTPLGGDLGCKRQPGLFGDR